jgi:hypothetical protein
LIVSVLSALHPWLIVLLDAWPKKSTEGLLIEDQFRLHWEERHSLGLSFVSVSLQDTRYPIWKNWEHLPQIQPSAWAPVLEIGVFDKQDPWTHTGEAWLCAYGVPVPSLRNLWVMTNQGQVRTIGLPVSRTRGRGQLLPTWVYWPGMILNLLVWNAAGLGLFISLDALVGLRRLRRGRCVICGYDIGDSALACPECGPGRPTNAATHAAEAPT